MGWIEFHTALRDHWKVKKLASILGVEYTTALGIIGCLWLWAADYASNGDLSRFTDDILRDAMRCNLEKCTLKALKCSEFVDESGKIHDWGKHGIRLLKSSRKRQKGYREKLRNGDVTVTSFSLSILSNLSLFHNIPAYALDKGFLNTFNDYLEMRRKVRKPATRRAIELICEKLDRCDLVTAKAMLEQSIVNSWQGVFPLKTERFEKKYTQQTQVRKEPKANPACTNCKGTGSFKLENGKTSQCWCVS